MNTIDDKEFKGYVKSQLSVIADDLKEVKNKCLPGLVDKVEVLTIDKALIDKRVTDVENKIKESVNFKTSIILSLIASITVFLLTILGKYIHTIK